MFGLSLFGNSLGVASLAGLLLVAWVTCVWLSCLPEVTEDGLCSKHLCNNKESPSYWSAAL